MKQYLDLLKHVLEHGHEKEDRTGTGTISYFGHQMRFDLSKGFPLLTTKKMFTKGIIHELLWFLNGDTNIKYLNDNGVHIWDAWADENGDLGPIYGKQWRNWDILDSYIRTETDNEEECDDYEIWAIGKYDQIYRLIDNIKNNPNSRRHIVSAWNVNDLPFEGCSPQDNVISERMALAPCHVMFQVYINEGKLSLMLYQRSTDLFLGLPFNIASYALLTHMLAQQTGYKVGEFIWIGGDCHIYKNHIEKVKEQLSREPYELPALKINRKPNSIYDYKYEDFEILNYKSHDAIKGEIAV